jgi:DNA-binding response OmpR family regulator
VIVYYESCRLAARCQRALRFNCPSTETGWNGGPSDLLMHRRTFRTGMGPVLVGYASRLSSLKNGTDNGEEKMVLNPGTPVAPAARLLVVDDDVGLCDLVAKYLEAEGFVVHAVHSGAEGEAAALEGTYDLIVLDVMLPDKKGFEVLKEIRARGRSPVLMLTAKGDEFDRVLGLELGADDYLSKPFSPRELVARIGAILRRSGWQAEDGNALRPPVIHSGDLELDPSAHAASRAGETLHLTSAEYDILRLFVGSPGQVLTRERLVEQVLDRKFSPFDRSIDLHISNLRKKLGPHPDGAERIRSIRGIGYLYAWPNSKASGT